GADPGQDTRNECCMLKNKVVGYHDNGKCLHLFDCGSLQKQQPRKKNGNGEVIKPKEKFWKISSLPPQAYWNREQEELNKRYNPILSMLANQTGDVYGSPNISHLNYCEPDLRVMSAVTDFNNLPDKFKDFLLYLRCRNYSLVTDQPNKVQRSPSCCWQLSPSLHISPEGDVIHNTGPHRNKKLKYYIPEVFFSGVYILYAGGRGFPYSGHLALRLYNINDQVHLYPIDDVYTGMCLQKLGLIPEKRKGFSTFDIEEKNKNNICSYVDLMLVHSRKPQEMIDIWSRLQSAHLKC
ncbi:Hypothetical predicted protein, partial [Marmota monax]